MNTAERAKAVAKVIKDKDQFYIRRPDGTMEYVNCVDEMKRLAMQVVVLREALEKISSWGGTEWWCRECGWTGTEAMWTEGYYEYPDDKDAICPICGYNNEGQPVSYLDEFDPEEYARQALKQAEEV